MQVQVSSGAIANHQPKMVIFGLTVNTGHQTCCICNIIEMWLQGRRLLIKMIMVFTLPLYTHALSDTGLLSLITRPKIRKMLWL